MTVASPPSPPSGSKWSLLRTFTAHDKPVSSIKFSPDGRFLASASADRTIKVWDFSLLSSPSESTIIEPKVIFQGHSQGISDVSWSSNSTYLVSASDDKTVRIWDLEQCKNVSILGTPMLSHSILSNPADIHKFTSNGSTSIVSGPVGDDDPGHTSYVYCCEFNPQGTLIVSGSYDKTVRLWDIRTSKCVYKLMAHRETITCVDFCYDGTLLVTASTDGLVRIWDVASMQCLREIIMTPNVPIVQARFTPNAKYIVVATLESCLMLWDYTTSHQPTLLKTYQGHVNQKYSLSIGFLQQENQGHLLSGSENGCIIMWNISTQQIIDTWNTNHSIVLSLSVHLNQKMVATSQENTISIWIKKE